MRMKIFNQWLWLVGMLAILLLDAALCAAQSAAVGEAGMPDPVGSPHAVPQLLLSQDHSSYSTNDSTEAEIRMRRLAYQAEEKRMVKETNQLLELAKKLNAEVASQRGAVLTPVELREVAEIQKLAHSVRTKMTSPVAGGLMQVGPYREFQ
jgi:hypothetical protein